MSTVNKLSFFSSMLNTEWDYMCYIPEGYEVSQLPVFYLLHGASHPVNVWFDKGQLQQHLDKAIAANIIKPMIVITPYSLQDGFSWYIDQEGFPYQTAFIQELIPHIENTLGGTRPRNQRIIGGSSMGGYGSLGFSLLYPNYFNSVLLVAPAIWDDISEQTIPQHSFKEVFKPFHADNQIWHKHLYHNHLENYLAQNTPIPFYISAGDRDSLGLEYYAAKLHKTFREHNIKSILRIVDGEHGDWIYYPQAIIDGLSHLSLL